MEDFMRKIISLVSLGSSFAALLFLVACGVPKNEYNNVISENQKLKETISQLEDEIKTLKETDQYYYQSGADEFSKGNYIAAIEWMDKLKLKFPNSSLTDSASKLVKDANNEIALVYEKEKTTLNTLIQNSAKIDIEEAISNLKAYIQGDHPADLIEVANNSLSAYKDAYEKERAQREIEQSVGVRLTDYSTGWGVYTGSRLFTPQLTLKFINIKDEPISESIEIRVDFIETSKNEIFGDDTHYLISSGDTPLQPAYTKSAYINCRVGYRSYFSSWEMGSLPNITADVYINDRLYKKIPIRKGYK
jgi:tetratricopeptide (TPR) repeat protein